MSKKNFLNKRNTSLENVLYQTFLEKQWLLPKIKAQKLERNINREYEIWSIKSYLVYGADPPLAWDKVKRILKIMSFNLQEASKFVHKTIQNE